MSARATRMPDARGREVGQEGAQEAGRFAAPSAAWIPVGWLYGLAARLHRACARRLRALRPRPACAVVSVGALTVGGAGKTPLAAALAAGLAARGHRVVLASRGYGGRSRAQVTRVDDRPRGARLAVEVGDEPLVLAAHAPGVPVLVGRDRRIVGHHAVSKLGAEILVLDDGFQHHRLARDLDIVAVDAASGLGNGRVLPAGPLREPGSSLRHADWLCVVGDADAVANPMTGATERSVPVRDAVSTMALRDDFRRSGRFALAAHRQPKSVVSLDGARRLALGALAGRRVGLVCGLARPESFRRTVESLGAEVACLRAFPDHHAYVEADLRDLDPALDLWLTSEKDAVKLEPAWVGRAALFVLGIEVVIDAEREVFAGIEAILRAAGRLPAAGPGSGS
ncbi:MAG: tetraacyldisaccharide 4'-kinase [Deltaproteobacteria bacterium]|nr:tetraacyldisaccharide 4'-kinase [Deltaproteobacteria bacterium]